MRRRKAIRCSVCGFDLQPEDKIIMNAIYLGTVQHVDCVTEKLGKLPKQMIFDQGTYSYLKNKRAKYFDVISTMK